MTKRYEGRRARVTAYLSDGSWRTETEIKAATGVNRKGMIMAGMLEDGTLLGLTEAGFKLTRLATDAEVSHCLNSLRSRSASILARVDAISIHREAA